MTKAFLLASMAALALAVPAAAQELGGSETPSAADNVDCAIWASYQIAVAPENDARNAFAIALSWYIGLYEGETGKPIDDAMAARTAEMDEADIDGLTAGCLARFGAFGERLKALSERIDAQDEQQL